MLSDFPLPLINNYLTLINLLTRTPFSLNKLRNGFVDERELVLYFILNKFERLSYIYCLYTVGFGCKTNNTVCLNLSLVIDPIIVIRTNRILNVVVYEGLLKA